MINKNNKRKLYLLLDHYLSGNINERTLCDGFYDGYDLEINHKYLTKREVEIFSELSIVLSRYSEFKEDHLLDPKAFSTKEELIKQVKKSVNDLVEKD